MTLYGYAGRILRIDLSFGSITKEGLDPAMARELIGGIGMSARLLFDTVKPHTDPVSPRNALICSSTPFSGTSLIGTNKTDWTSMSPLNPRLKRGIWNG